MLTCTAVGLILAGLIYRTIQNINNTLSVFSNREHADHWLYSYLDLNKQGKQLSIPANGKSEMYFFIYYVITMTMYALEMAIVGWLIDLYKGSG